MKAALLFDFRTQRGVVLLQPRATLGPLGRAPLLEERAQFRQRETSIGDDRKIDRLELADVLRPLARAQLHEPDLDDRAAGADAALLFVRRSVQTVERAEQVTHIKSEDEIGDVEHCFRAGEVQRMARRDVQASLEIDDRCTNELRERGHRAECVSIASGVFGDDDRALGLRHPIRCIGECRRVGLRRGRQRRFDLRLHAHRTFELVLLQPGVVAEVDRASGLGRRDAVAAREGRSEVGHARGLVVPLHEVADRVALHERAVDPVDVRPALAPIERAGRAEDEHRHAIDMRVVNRHRRVQETDDVVDDRGHRLAGHLRVAMGDRDSDLLVGAGHDLGAVAAVVDDGIVKAAIGRARIQRRVFDAEAFEEIDDDVGAVARGQKHPPARIV